MGALTLMTVLFSKTLFLLLLMNRNIIINSANIKACHSKAQFYPFS